MKDQRCNFSGGMMPFVSGMPTNMMMFPNNGFLFDTFLAII